MSQQIHVTLICQFKAAASAVDTLSLQQEDLVRISSLALAGAGCFSLVLLVVPVKPSAVGISDIALILG